MEGYKWDFSVVWEYREVLIAGTLTTLKLSIIVIIISMSLGLGLALLRSSGSRFVLGVITLLVQLVRALPVLVLLVWIYYCLPILTGFSLDAFTTVVLALSIYSSAFYAEIFRAGLQAVGKGHQEAALSVGMTRLQVLRRITGPIAFQNIFPPLVSQCVLVLKNTTLAGYVAVADTLYLGQQIGIRTFRPLEILTVIAVLFLLMIVPLTITANICESVYRKRYFA